jgi:hypothetical protein
VGRDGGWAGSGRGLGRVGGGGRAGPGQGRGRGGLAGPDPVEQPDRGRIRPYQTGTILDIALTSSKTLVTAVQPAVGVVPT